MYSEIIVKISLNINSESAILTAKNVDDATSIKILDVLHDKAISFVGRYTIVAGNGAVYFPAEFSNSLDLPGLPPHKN